MRKCLSHHFLKNASELRLFLSDEQGFLSFKKREESLSEAKFDTKLINKIFDYVSLTVKGNTPALRELDEKENQIYNYEVLFFNLGKRVQAFSDSMIRILEQKRIHVSNMVSFVSSVQDIGNQLGLGV